MDRIVIDATNFTPYVEFDFIANRFVIEGHLFPFNAAGFITPLLYRLEEHFRTMTMQEVKFVFRVTYFNMEAIRSFHLLFDVLQYGAARRNRVLVDWCYHEEDEDAREYADDLVIKYNAIDFNLMASELEAIW